MTNLKPEIRRIYPAGGEAFDEADLENAYLVEGQPWLRADFVVSLDGAVELEGRSSKLGGPADRAAFLAMRATCDVILVGAGTARAEKYGPVKLSREVEERRSGRGQSRRPRLAVVSESARLPADLPLFGGQDMPLVVTTSRGASSDPSLHERASVLECGDTAVDLPSAVRRLREMGFPTVLTEGGPTLLASLLVNGLVDELCLTVSPVLAGSGTKRLLGDLVIASPFQFRLASVLEADDLLLIRYARVLR
jgi:riboflavin biosynthesis pyrimidine reductase